MRSWWAVVERLRTWIIEQNLPISSLFVDLDENEDRRRRAGVPRRPFEDQGSNSTDRGRRRHGNRAPNRSQAVALFTPSSINAVDRGALPL